MADPYAPFKKEMEKYYGKASDVGKNIKKAAKKAVKDFKENPNRKIAAKAIKSAVNDPVARATAETMLPFPSVGKAKLVKKGVETVAEAAKKPINKVVKRLKGRKLDKKKSADKLWYTETNRDFNEMLKEYNRTENLFKQRSRRGGLTEVDKTPKRRGAVTEVTEDELNALKKKVEDLPDDEWDDIMGKLDRMGRSQDRANRRARKLSNKFIVGTNNLPRKHPDYEETWTNMEGFGTKDNRSFFTGEIVIDKTKDYTDYATGFGAPNAYVRIPNKPISRDPQRKGGLTEVTPEEQMDDIAKKFLEKRKNRKGKGTKKKKKKEE